MKIEKTIFGFLICLGLFPVYSTVLAQEGTSDRNIPSRYYLGTEEQVLLPVNILGLVSRPGQYMVPYRTDLISLVAFAGGFREEAKITDIKIVRNTPSNGKPYKRARVFKVDVKKYLKNGDQSQIPQLMPDDTIIVSGTTTQLINNVFDFVSKAVMLAQLYFYIKVANDR